SPHPPSAPDPPPAPTQIYTDEDAPMSSAAITTDRMLRPADSVQEARGFRAMLQRLLNPRARSRVEEEERHRQLIALCRTQVRGCRRIAVISRKGGIGKTTTALMLGHQFANLRDDRVLALDANPDAGSLGDRVPSETRGTVTDILHDADRLDDYADLRRLTSRAQSGLEVVASDNDPRITEALGEEDYRRVLNVLADHYSVLVCDTGTGVLDSATRGLLNQADQIVLCATQSVDASRVSALTLDWMDQNGYDHLVRDAVVSINAVHTGLADIDRLQAYFERRCRAVVRIPWDMRLALGAETTLEELQPATQTAYLNLAAMVAAGFR
ncbi:MAG TPA: MinD/ParA family protein, partial [Candidatus Binatia bacterium]|nr:MinD/ParA family protein [Candidatus Binatia bacterium]